MARIRTIKPDFFRHEALQDLEAANPGRHAMLTFAGLFTACDKNGVFEWRPRRLALDVLPFLWPNDNGASLDKTLELLRANGFVKRLGQEGKVYGYIPTFREHQRISGKEATEPAKYPKPSDMAQEEAPKPREAPEKPEKGFPPAVLALTGLFAEQILANNPAFRELQSGRRDATLSRWAADLDKMLRLDKRPEEEVHRVILWCQADGFWKANILSGAKLREKFDQLKAQMSRPAKSTNSALDAMLAEAFHGEERVGQEDGFGGFQAPGALAARKSA